MEKTPAGTGLLWIREGLALFRKQPAELSTLFLLYSFATLIVTSAIPPLGMLLQVALLPMISVAMIAACASVEQDKRVRPRVLLTGFQSGARSALLRLGGLYVFTVFIAVGVTMVAASFMDDSLLRKLIANEITLEAAQKTGALFTRQDKWLMVLVLTGICLPATMAFWFAAPLVLWKDMGLFKAMFYSFFAVLRSTKAFIVYVLAWVTITLGFGFLTSFVMVITGSAQFGTVVLVFFSIVASVVTYATHYASYKFLFGTPEIAVAPPP